jgi:hypothetical protein
MYDERRRGRQPDWRSVSPGRACREPTSKRAPATPTERGQFSFLLREGDRLEQLPGVREHVDQLTRAVHGLVSRGRQTQALRPDLPASYQTRLVLAAVFTAWEAVREGELGSLEAAGAATAALLEGIGTRA